MRTVPSELPLRCRCGQLRGVAAKVAPSTGLRFVCYCKDCQAFARFLGRPDVLDPAGGTDIFHMPTGRVSFAQGAKAVRCVTFSGRILRWYAGCCGTPIGNTAGPGFPVVGLIHSFMSLDGCSRDEFLGPARCRIFERSALGPLPSNAPPPPSFRVFVDRAARLLGWWMAGLGRPNPFFDVRTKAPLSQPRLLTPSERTALDDKA